MKTQTIASLIAVTAATLGFMAPARADINLVPDMEGEVSLSNENFNGAPFACLDEDQCLTMELFPFIESIVSETDTTTGQQSRLFIDNLTTSNTYSNGSETVQFGTRDRGTNHLGYWFRPSDTRTENGSVIEDGALEVGTFTFNFTTTFQALTIDFFDTESNNTTGVTQVNGSAWDTDWVAKGRDGNIVSQTFYDVNSITLTLGGPRSGWIGDGVNFRASASVPEPATLTGLAVVGLAFAGQKLRKSRQV